MISIRLSILLLAIVTIASTSSIFFIEYNDIRKKVDDATDVLAVSEEIRSLSELIHSLQKERGLTAGHLTGHADKMLELFDKQREVMDVKLNKIDSNKILENMNSGVNFYESLTEMRRRIDSGGAEWGEARRFYSSAIQTLLELIVTKVSTLNHSDDIIYEIKALTYLAYTRENLGLIRATLNRAYQVNSLPMEERVFLSQRYGSLADNLQIFDTISKTHIEETGDSAWSAEIRSDVYNSVILQIENALVVEKEKPSGSATVWWRETTLVIDIMKKIENDILDQIRHHMMEHITDYNQRLVSYGIFAFTLMLAVTLLTALTVLRILKALSILIQSLKCVERNQDYSMRINTWSGDEFGLISASINNLLDYTDKIIKDKEFLATTDLLTGVMNRRSFTIAAEKEIRRSNRYGNHLSLIYCDIDFFKSINDEHGHSTGDEVLAKFAECLKSNLRETDFVGRWGGEEFIVLATDTDLDSAGKLAEKLRQKVMQLSTQAVEQLTCSFGVADRNSDESFAAWCERADQLLYQAKNSGRNKVCI